MTIHENGSRYNSLRKYEKLKNNPYDYKNNGLLKYLISYKIYNTKNQILKYVLNIYEQSIIYCLRYIDILKNYYNYNIYNR